MSSKKDFNRGAWTVEEDKQLAEVVSVHGAKKWKLVADKTGLNRSGKSCRLRWMNYLRPNIKRGNISDQEEDLIIRLHKLLGNRWSLIAGRLPGRTDNEIKNYWNSHLSKKIDKKKKKEREGSSRKESPPLMSLEKSNGEIQKSNTSSDEDHERSKDIIFDVDDFFDFSNEGPLSLEWMSAFVELS